MAYTTGESPLEIANEWTDVLDIPTTDLVNYVCIVNEGEAGGFMRVVDPDGNPGPSHRMPAGAMSNIPMAGFSGKVQLKSDPTKKMTGIYGHAGR